MKKIKVLFVAANPRDTPSLQLDEEIRAITEKIRASEYPNLLDLISVWAVRPDDLLQALNLHRPHIVHFSGHGSLNGEIVLVDGDGQPKSVSAKAIKSLFATLKDNIRVVVFNTCYSQQQAKAITEVIDCAIGMSTAIGDRAAVIFAASFYRAIGFGRSVKESFQQAKTSLLLEGIPEENTPKLLMKRGVDPSKTILIDVAISLEELRAHRFAKSREGEELRRTFQGLIESNPGKSSIQAFLRSNSHILGRWHKAESNKVLANVRFGENLADFAIGVFQHTAGTWEWTLVNLELPSHDLFTETGDTSPALTSALRKATEWRIWIQSHLQIARSTLPGISPLPSIAIIIGRRNGVCEHDKERITMLRISMPGVTINTYDSLIESIQRG